jgi:methylenetetrahydrofolate dehydrogenase (NADP+)/methenyltetrahydrofolate cyclohydrolase
MVKQNSILIDVGFTRRVTTDGRIRLMGDIHPRCSEFAQLITPVPGGIGPLTIAHLCRNTLNSYLSKRQQPLLPLSL